MSARLVSTLPLIALAVTGCRSEYDFSGQDDPVPLDNDHGQWLSMDVTPDDRLAVAYYDRTRSGLGFAVGTPGPTGVGWTHERVDGYPDNQGLDPGDRGRFASMAVGPDGHAWVSYQDTGKGALSVAHRVGKTWTTEVVDDSVKPTGLWTSLAIDADGHPVVAYHDAANGNLMVARFDGSAWSTAIAYEGTSFTGTDANGDAVIRPAAAGQFARLFILGNTEYIAFYDGAHQDLHLLEGFGGAYAHSVVHDQGDAGQWPSLWTDGDETLIAFHDVANQDLLIARRSGGGTFKVSVVDDGEYVGADTEVFKQGDTAAILYFDGHGNDMKLATDTGTGWIVEKLAGEGIAVGYHNEVVERDGAWWVASYDYTNRGIFARTLQP